MATPAQCHTLVSYYTKKYKARYGNEPIVNRNDARWKFDAILKGISVQETKELIDYWLGINSAQNHQLTWFFYNYDKLIEVRNAQAEDAARRDHMRHDSEERTKKWRERRANRSK